MQKRAAFSLVELSVVLVILGLLVGGVLTGRFLMRAADLRSVSTEYEKYTGAAQIFRDQYSQLPGDFLRATDYWGTASGGCPSGTRTGTQTCNGNGDRVIDDPGTGTQEPYKFWQHLANAGLIEGSYSGRSGPGHTNYHAVGGLNVPNSKLANVTWAARTFGVTGDGSWFDLPVANNFEVGRSIANYWNSDPAFRPEELYGIDRKMDDGMPGTGKLVAFPFSNCTTATASNQGATATYALTNATVVCSAVFPRAF